jgi:hypothetical protein
MARPYPTDAEILEIREDLIEAGYLSDDKDLQSYAEKALKKVKIDLEDQRGILWLRVWDSANSQYFEGSDGYTRNDDKIVRMISTKAVSMIFRDYAINMNADSQWLTVAEEYENLYMDLLKSAKLTVDTDDSGTIESDEDAQTGQTFMRR